MSKNSLIKRRKRQDAAWRKFMFYPQRIVTSTPKDWTEIADSNQRLIQVDSDPARLQWNGQRMFPDGPPDPYQRSFNW